jgi:hypothetical protein
VCTVVHNKVKKVAIWGIFHNGIGNLRGNAFGNGVLFGFNVKISDDVGVIETGESDFVLEVGMYLVIFEWEDLHGVVLLGWLGTDKIDREFGFVEGFDDADVLEVFLLDWRGDLFVEVFVLEAESRGFVDSVID